MSAIAKSEMWKVVIERLYGKGASQTRVGEKDGKAAFVLEPVKPTRGDRKRIRKLEAPMKEFLAAYESRVLEFSDFARYAILRLATLALVDDFLIKEGYEPVTWEGPSVSVGTADMNLEIKFRLSNSSRKSGIRD
jgi:hypothetical protein